MEIDLTARIVAQHANPSTGTFPGIDHTFHHDLYDITEQDIIDMGPIGLLIGATPCGDFSKLRLLPSKFSNGTELRQNCHDPRPGLDGLNGRKFRQLLLILTWVLKHNPDCEYFVEYLCFDDLPNDWDEVCSALGVPILVNAQDYSRTKRNRAYWHNFSNAVNLPPATHPPLNPNDCMGPGREFRTYISRGRECVLPTGASWIGPKNNPRADTKLPVLVKDERYAEDQHLNPEEAEGLMAMDIGCTAAPGVSARDRLRCIGNGWDIIVTTMLLSHCKLANLQGVTSCCSSSDASAQEALVHMLEAEGPEYLASILE